MSADRDATIRANIDRAFDFLADVYDDPSVLARVPDGSTLAFREIDLRGHLYRLTAAQRKDTVEGWTAVISGYTLTQGARLFERPVIDGRSTMHDLAAIVRTFRATGETAAAALDALETKLRTAIEEAIHPASVEPQRPR